MNTQPRHPKCRALPVEPHPDIHFSAMIPRRGVKIKIFLSVVIPVVKAAFVPLSAIGGNPANAGVARLCGVSPHPIPDTTTALPKQARYQLRYTRLLSFLSGWSYSPKAVYIIPYDDLCRFPAISSRLRILFKTLISTVSAHSTAVCSQTCGQKPLSEHPRGRGQKAVFIVCRSAADG